MKISTVVSLIFLTMLFFACKGQEKKNMKVSVPEASSTGKQNKKEVPTDFDSYFVENQAKHQAPQTITRNILQDKKGRIWFAAYDGINHYEDGKFYNHTNLDGLRRYRAFSLMEDNEGKIWIGTVGAGLYIYDDRALEKNESPWTNLTTKDGLVHDVIGAILQDSNGNVWIGTGEGVSFYDGKSFKNYTKEDGLADGDINGIIEDKDGKIWIAARGEACYFDGTTFTKLNTPLDRSFVNARSIILDSRGNIWMGGNDGLWRYDGKKYVDFQTPFIGNLYEDSKGTIWVTQSVPGDIYRMSLQRYDMHNLYAPRPESTMVVEGDGQVFGVIEDSEGNIWFGHERGICKYDGLTFEYFKP